MTMTDALPVVVGAMMHRCMGTSAQPYGRVLTRQLWYTSIPVFTLSYTLVAPYGTF